MKQTCCSHVITVQLHGAWSFLRNEVLQLFSKSVALYGTQQYIIVLKTACNSEAICNILWRTAFHGEDVLSHANFQGGGNPLISSPWLLVPYIRSTWRVKVKVIFFLCTSWRNVWGTAVGPIASHILNLGIWLRWEVSLLHALATLHPGTNSGTPWIWSWVIPRVSLDHLKKKESLASAKIGTPHRQHEAKKLLTLAGTARVIQK
jgi:hypothetical protein